jgi:hypothetical protein
MLLPNSAKLGFVRERGAVFSPSAIASMLSPEHPATSAEIATDPLTPPGGR